MSSFTTLMLSDLILAVRQRADFVNNQFITDEEFTAWINASYFELYDILVQKYGDNYYVSSSSTFVAPGGVEFYNLPSDFYKLLGVDISDYTNTNSWRRLRPFNFSDRNKWNNAWGVRGNGGYQYRLNGNQLWLIPAPVASATFRIWYVPQLVPLVNLTDTVDGISGWTEYIIVDCCIKALAKEESDPSIFMAQKSALLKRIEEAAENRDAGMPATVSDTRRDGFSNFGMFGNGGFFGEDY